MKFFIDTANIEEIKKGLALGMVDGVTTNPSLVAKEPRPFVEILQDICKLVEGPVSAEVISLEADGMVAEARELVKIADNIVVKIPMIEEGLKAVKQIGRRGHQDQRDPDFFGLTGSAGGQGRGDLCQPFCRPA